jgi:glycosyltransferase involved in cell wall biosynthesis
MKPDRTICFIADAGSPHTRKWVEGCAGLNCRVVVISHHPGVIAGAEVIVHPLTLTGFFCHFRKVRRIIRSFQPSVAHAHQFGAHALYAWASGCGRLVISAWGSDILVKAKQSLFLGWLASFLARRADLITCDSPDIAAELLRRGVRPDRLLNIPFGIPRAVFEELSRARKDPDRSVILSPRLHEPVYNISLILEVFARIAPEFPQAELRVLGDGSLTQSLQEKALRLGVAERVHFTGRVSLEESYREMAASQIMVSVPSSDGTPVSLLEAMSAGSFPVLSDLPAYHDWIQDGRNGLLVSPGPEALATALCLALTNDKLRNDAARLNRAIIAERAIWEDCFQPVLEYYKGILDKE